MIIIGADPGLSGAVAHYNVFKDELIVINNQYDGQKFATREFFDSMCRLPMAQVAVLENVKINGGWSAKANATLQRGVGSLGSLLNQRADSVHLVSPARWKSQLFLTSDKDLSMHVAHLRFPKQRHLIVRHDIAEACLLVSWYLHGDFTVEVDE